MAAVLAAQNNGMGVTWACGGRSSFLPAPATIDASIRLRADMESYVYSSI